MVKEAAVIQPTTQYSLNDDAIEVRCYGRPHNWSLKSATDFGNHIQICEDSGAEKIFTLNAGKATSTIAATKDRTQLWQAPRWLHHIREPMHLIVADGMHLQPGEAFFLPTGDCPTIIAYCEKAGHLIAAHAGRDCLWDRRHILTGEKSREHPSIVDAIMEHFAPWKKELHILVCCGIRPEYFAHPSTSLNNEMMLEYFSSCPGAVQQFAEGKLDLFAIIHAQFKKHGVSPNNVARDDVDTYQDGGWWSHRRWVNQGKQGPDGRNGVLVIRQQ